MEAGLGTEEMKADESKEGLYFQSVLTRPRYFIAACSAASLNIMDYWNHYFTRLLTEQKSELSFR